MPYDWSILMNPNASLLDRAGLDKVRVGKLIEFDLAGAEDPQGEARKMCEQLLANTVIESYRIETA